MDERNVEEGGKLTTNSLKFY